MLNFPLPYTDELIYSVVARAGVHWGITSPKQLLDEVFADRLVIATVDLPNHLDRLRSLYPPSLGYSVEKLAYEHTLFPIYAPFATEGRRKQCLQKMAGPHGAVHLILGVAASRLKQWRYLRYCPICLQRQLAEKGEYYWLRQWQIVGADCCWEHGQLIDASINRHDYHRHQFFPASSSICPPMTPKSAVPSALKVARQIDRLLHHYTKRAASFEQWSRYYRQLAVIAGCLDGRVVRHGAVRERVLAHWPANWLNVHGLTVSETETSWLHAMFRKHRKSFSYLEHIVVLDSLLSSNWQIDDVLAEVVSIRTRALYLPDTDSTASGENTAGQLADKRSQWLALIEGENIKRVRLKNGALYSWLYRHDRVWLLSVNRRFRLATSKANHRVDWQRRDFSVCRQLVRIHNACKFSHHCPRRSRGWYLSKLDKSATVEKNIHRMPLSALFFERHCEAVSDYQIRRLNLAMQSLGMAGIQKWRLLRRAGLSEERLSNEARSRLNDILEN